MGLTLATAFQNALTTQGMLDIWTNGFGIAAPVADHAALILGPANLLTGPLLSSLTLPELQLDNNTVTPVSGLYSVELVGDTGLVVASLSVTLPVTPSSQPVGVALYHEYSQHLWYVSAFSQWPTSLPADFQWNVQIPLGTCMQS